MSSPSRASSPVLTRATGRRRQRSVRVTLAVALLAAAAAVVVLALPSQSPVWLSVSSVVALLCGFVACRIVHTELRQSRRDNATDRAAQADAYRTMFSERASEHAEFTTAMTERLAMRDRSIRELEGTLLLAEKRAVDAEQRVKRESRRANEAAEQIAELQQALEIRRAEEADELATWEGLDLDGAFGTDGDTVADLLAWEDRANASLEGAAPAGQRRHA